MAADKEISTDEARAFLIAEKKRRDEEAAQKLNAFLTDNKIRIIPVLTMRDGQVIQGVEVEALD